MARIRTRVHKTKLALLLAGFTGLALARGHAGKSFAAASPVVQEPEREARTASNDAVGSGSPTFVEAISRSLSVNNAATQPATFSEAISRSQTVVNRTVPTPNLTEAISRSQTVYNRVPANVVFNEAISRSQTVFNDTTRKVVFTEVISRSWTVLNHPELRLEVQSAAGDSDVYARCGQEVAYRVLGTLSDGNNRGLALVKFDVRYDGGSLEQVETPKGPASCDNPMASFEAPDGISGPAGYAGASFPPGGPVCGHPSGLSAGIRGVGGAQNSFGFRRTATEVRRFVDCFSGPDASPEPAPPQSTESCLARFDDDTDGNVDLKDFATLLTHGLDALNGGFLPGVAQQSGCGPATLAEGTLIAPSTPGEYHVWVENALANAAAGDADGNPSWKTRRAVVTIHNQLIVHVVDARCDAGDFEYFQFSACFSGPGAAPDPPAPYMTREDCLGAFDEDKDDDVDLTDFAYVSQAFEARACTDQRIVSSSMPEPCTIDARQPTTPNGLMGQGLTSITLDMACNAADLEPADFTLSTIQDSSAPPIRRTPTIVSVSASGRNATLQLSAPIDPGRWTCFSHTASNSRRCVGFLPGDVNQNGTVEPADETLLMQHLTNPNTPTAVCDINRDGSCHADDKTRLENLFYGDFQYDFWLGRTLPACPSDR